MSKFIKVQLEHSNKWVLINATQIIEMSLNPDGYVEIYLTGGGYKVHETLEQIEAQLLRDEFAKAALAAVDYFDYKPEVIARDAYLIADAMLKERSK